MNRILRAVLATAILAFGGGSAYAATAPPGLNPPVVGQSINGYVVQQILPDGYVGTKTTTTSAAKTAAVSAAWVGCRTVDAVAEHDQWWGWGYRFHSVMGWCAAQNVIDYLGDRYTYGETNSFAGLYWYADQGGRWVNRVIGGKGSNLWERDVSGGPFLYCRLYTGCDNHGVAWINMTVYASGGVYATGGAPG